MKIYNLIRSSIGLLVIWVAIACGQALDQTRLDMHVLTEKGSTCFQATLDAAIGDTAWDNSTMVLTATDRSKVACTWNITANTTIPSNRTVQIPHGAKLDIASGITLTINGPIHAGAYPIFQGDGTVVYNGQTPINAMWFVTSGAGTDADPYRGWDDDIATIQNQRVLFPRGVFGTTGVLSSGQPNFIHWSGSGMGDVNTGFRTVIKGLTDGRANAYVLKADSVRYVWLSDMAFDADEVKESTIIIDATLTGISGTHWTNLYLFGATLHTAQLGPTASVQVDQGLFHNVWFTSAAPSDSQLYVNSSNAINLAFHGGAFAGASPYGIHINLGTISLYDTVFSATTTADIFLSSESSLVYVNRAHSESLGLFLSAPAAVPAASYQGVSSHLYAVNHAVIPTAGISVNIAQIRAVTIESSFFGGDVVVTSPATVFAQGPVTFGAQSTGSITAFANAGNDFTTVTSTSHGLSNDDIVTISEATNYNGVFVVSAVTTHTFDLGTTFVANDATGTWVQVHGFTGTGRVHRSLSPSDPVSIDSTGANSPYTITNRLGLGTRVTSTMLHGEAYLPHNRGLRWANAPDSDFGSYLMVQTHSAIADGTAVDLSTGNAMDPNAIVLILNSSDTTMALYHLRGGSNATIEVLDPSTAFVNTDSGTATRIYWSAANSRYELRNSLSTGAKTYNLFFLSGTQ